jgi:hypothetical protein
MIHPAGWEEASLDGKTVFAGFAGTHGVGCSFRTVSARGGTDVRCQRELCDQAHARVDATGDCQPRKFGGHKRYVLAEHEDKVRALVAEKPDLTITELWQKITACGIKVGRSAVARFLLHLQLTFKKTIAARGHLRDRNCCATLLKIGCRIVEIRSKSRRGDDFARFCCRTIT